MRWYALAGIMLVVLVGSLVSLEARHSPVRAAGPVVSHGAGEAEFLLSSVFWHPIVRLVPKFPPAWQHRYQELRSIAEDTDSLELQLRPMLDELARTLDRAQRRVVFMLLDLPPYRQYAPESSYLLRLMEEWQWYLEEPVRQANMNYEALALYTATLQDIRLALEHVQARENDAAVLEVSAYMDALLLRLDAHVVSIRQRIGLWLDPAHDLLGQMRAAISATEAILPNLWLHYYTAPLRPVRLTSAVLEGDLQSMVANLLRGEVFIRQLSILLLINVIIAGAAVWFFYGISRQRGTEQHDSTLASHMAGGLAALPRARKASLVVAALCLINILADSLPQIHLHMPYLVLQGSILIVALAFWAREGGNDPGVFYLAVPVSTGLVLLHADAPPLWVSVFLGSVYIFVAMFMFTRQGRRSTFFWVWGGMLLLSGMTSLMGFGRMSVPLMLLALFSRASANVLRRVYNSRALRGSPLFLTLLLPLLTALLLGGAVTAVIACPGLATLLDYWQNTEVFFLNLRVQPRQVALLLALSLALMVFNGISRQFLHRAAHDKGLLDASALPVVHAALNGTLWLFAILFALGVLGVDVRSLAFIGGGLTVGLGIASRSILSNFFSGLVLIFGKVVRAGDLIEVNGVLGKVHNVNMRATVVETLTSGILLVPNEEMLNCRLTNWTRNNRHVREEVSVEVESGNDVQTVLAALQEAAAGHAGILDYPPPRALFAEFGENGLRFVLQVWVVDVSSKLTILSTLRHTINQIFALRGITLSVPRRDVRVLEATLPQV